MWLSVSKTRIWVPSKFRHLSKHAQPWVGNPSISNWVSDSDSHFECFTLDCNRPQCLLGISVQRSQRDHIICKKQRCSPTSTKVETLHLFSAPRNSVHEGYEHNRWQRPVLMKSPTPIRNKSGLQPAMWAKLHSSYFYSCTFVFYVLCVLLFVRIADVVGCLAWLQQSWKRF